MIGVPVSEPSPGVRGRVTPIPTCDVLVWTLPVAVAGEVSRALHAAGLIGDALALDVALATCAVADEDGEAVSA